MDGLQHSEALFRELVAQPLLLQSPLQAVLELLFGALKTQGATISQLQARVGSLDASAAAAAALGRQQDEARAGADARLAALESRLHGASNVAGRQAALDEIASLIGVAVPEAAPPRVDADAPAHFGWSALAPAPAPDLADSFLPTGEGSASISPAAHGAPVVQPPTLTQPVGAAASCGSDGAARAGEGCSLAARAGEAAECEGEDAAAEPATAAGVSLSPQRSRSGSRPGSSVAVVAIHGAAAADGAASDQHAQVPGRASLTSGHAGRAAAVQPPSHSASPRGNSMSSTAPAGCPASTADAAEDAAGQVPAASAGPAAAVAVAAGTSIPANPVLGGPASRPSDSSNGQPSAMAGLPKRSPATEVPSPAALFAAMQAGKAASKAVPSTAAAAAFGMAHLQQPAGSAAVGPASPAVARTVSSSVPAAEQQVAATAGAACEPAPGGAAPPASSTDAEPAAGVGPAEVEAAAQDSMRQKTGAGARLLEVVNLLRKRPSLKPSGLLWKLQASLAEAVAEQERLKGEVTTLQEELQAVRGSSASGLERCGERIDAVEEAVAAASAAAAAVAAHGRGAIHSGPVEGFKVLEERVASIDGQVASVVEQVASVVEQVTAMDEQVAASARRISVLEEAQELSTSAARLVRASSSGSRGDLMEALQGHLLAQQQKLQAQVEAMGTSIRQGVPGQVSEAVAGAASEIGRRLAERLATRQDLQTVSLKVNSKVSREDVERMLRAYKAAAAPPPAPATEPNGPAAGMRFRCISCDTALQPFVFAAAPGAGAGAAPAPAHTADLRYTQLPVVSPARNASQPWTAAGTLGAEPAAVGLAAVGQPAGEPSRLSAVGSPAGEVPAVQPPSPRGGRQSTRAASRLGSPASWVHRMSRGQASGGNSSQADEAASPSHAWMAAGSSIQQDSTVAALSVGGISRPVTGMPPAAGGVGGEGGEAVLPLGGKIGVQWEQRRGTSELSEAGIRDEPATGGTGAGADELSPLGGSKSSLPALPQSPGGRIKAGRPATASPGRSGGAVGVQRRGSPAL